MVLKKLTVAGALFASLAAGYSADAQINIPSAEFEHRALESAPNNRPFATPGVFDYDAQVFAPFEFTSDEEKDPQTGFFLTFDKTYTSVSSSGSESTDDTAQRVGNNYISGERYEFGWMNDTDDGWNFAYQNSSGIFFTNGQDVLVSNPMLVETRFATFEINRVFRQEMNHGGYFEPYIGMQYLNFQDESIEDSTQFLGAITGTNRFKQEVDNNAFGVHAGARFNRRFGRWRTTTDGAIVTAYNQQKYFATDLFVSGASIDINEVSREDQSFVPALDLQFELSYNISRDISLRGGLQALWAFDGVARANTLTSSINPNSAFGINGPDGPGSGLFDQDYIAAGFLFGFEWKR